MIALVTCTFLALGSPVDEPFRDLTFESALAEAKESDKVIFIDFFTTWCGPCKKLDATTWKDAGVRSWLEKHTVALKIDAEQEAKLATRYRVRAYPSLVFINPDGSERDRIVGYVDAKEFLSQAADALSGIDAVDRARRELKGRENDPMVRGHLADVLVEFGQYEEALKHYLWCFDHGLEHDRAYHGVRLSFLMGDIGNLGNVYAPAREALVRRRDEREKRILSGKAVDYMTATEYSSLNEALNDRNRTLWALDQLIEAERRDSFTARFLANEITALLMQAGRYRDLYEIAGANLPGFREGVERFEMEKEVDPGEEFLVLSRAQLISTGIRCYQVMLAVEKPDQARQVLSHCLEVDSRRYTYQRFITAALKVERAAAATNLAELAVEGLEGKDRERFQRWWKRRKPEGDRER